MKQTITTSLKLLFADRAMASLSVLLIVSTVIYVVYVALSLSPSELQIATRYTAFGETQFYRNKWYYLLTFIAFGLIATTVHLTLMAKLNGRSMRTLALAFGWLSLIILAILFVITRSVLHVAYLS